MKLCTNCKHYNGKEYCTRWRVVSPVDGKERTRQIWAHSERNRTKPDYGWTTPDPCGPDGKHWVEATTPVQSTAKPTPWWRRAFGMANVQDQTRRENT